jgi:acyl-coenzyme A thioesterase PaaI-like protein
MMFDMIREQMGKSVPFANYAGVELLELSATTGVARLVQRPDVSNHIGSVHAGALFTLAEAASGAAMAGVFAQHLMAIRPVVSQAKIAYLKVAKGVLLATASLARPPADVLAEFDDAGQTAFEIAVEVKDESDITVATFTATWNIKKAR